MKLITFFAALPVAALAFAFAATPAALAAVNKADRALCTGATAADPASLLKCIESLNKRLSEIEDEPEDVEAPDDTDARIAALEGEVRSAKLEVAAVKEDARLASEQVAATNVKIDALSANADRLEAAAAEAKAEATAAKEAAAAADARADRAGNAADIALAKAEEAAAKADAAARDKGDDRGGDDIDDKEGSFVKAPFTVTDDSGAAIMTVAIEGSNAILTLGSEETSTTLIAGSSGAGVAAEVGERIVKMEVMDGTTGITATDPEDGSVAMGHINGGFNGFIYSKGEAGVVNLGVTNGGTSAVRVFDDSGNDVFSAGANPKEGGAAAMYLGSGDDTSVEIQAYSGGNGEIRVMGEGATPTIALRGKESSVQVIGDGGKTVGEFTRSVTGGGKIALTEPGGAAAFWAGHASDGGLACISYKEKHFCLGPTLAPVGGR
jgi:hypothetical protein